MIESTIETDILAFLKENESKRIRIQNPIYQIAFKIDKLSLLENIEAFSDNFSSMVFFHRPEHSYEILAAEPLTSISANLLDLQQLDKKIAAFSDVLISNSSKENLPLFLGTVKFPSDRTSDEWKSFKEVHWFIPKYMLIKDNDDVELILNLFRPNEISDVEFAEMIENENRLIIDILNTQSEVAETRTRINKHNEDAKEWIAKAQNTISEIRKNDLKKIVLSRRVKYSLDGKTDWQRIFVELQDKYPACLNFLYKSDDSFFFGSTPEVLASFSKKNFSTEALAGSMKRGNNEKEDQLLEESLIKSDKNQKEHSIVIDHLTSSLSPFLSKFEMSESPIVKKLFNIQHLQTKISGELKEESSYFAILQSIFPTPAVCGIPASRSITTIKTLENFDRGLFSGITGWLNANGYGEFFVTIRSALLKENNLYAYAGCGLVEESDPKEEYEETELKLKPILSLFSDEN